MSFGLCSTGFVIVIGGPIYAAYRVHVPAHWIAVGAVVLLGVGILAELKVTSQKNLLDSDFLVVRSSLTEF